MSAKSVLFVGAGVVALAGCGLHSISSIQWSPRAVHAKYYAPADLTAEQVAAAIDPAQGHPVYTWFDRDIRGWIERTPERPTETLVLLGRGPDDVCAAVRLEPWAEGVVVHTSAAERYIDRHLQRTLAPLLPDR